MYDVYVTSSSVGLLGLSIERRRVPHAPAVVPEMSWPQHVYIATVYVEHRNHIFGFAHNIDSAPLVTVTAHLAPPNLAFYHYNKTLSSSYGGLPKSTIIIFCGRYIKKTDRILASPLHGILDNG
jgi:hypothetical protein